VSRTKGDVLAAIEAVTARLTGASLRWEWDDRFAAALAVVEAPADQAVLALVSQVFAAAWDAQTIQQAPDAARELASSWGLQRSQRLFALDLDDDPLLFAAWWPWGSGTTFSLRVGCSASDAAQGEALLRAAFSL
jgi:hypothetical protein